MMEVKKKAAVMQPYIFPYIGYFQLLHAVDEFVLYDDVQYIRRGWINRNRILINNQASLFHFRVDHGSVKDLINEKKLNNFCEDKAKFLKMCEISYRKAPYFEEVFPLLEKCMEYNGTAIYELIFLSLEIICNYIKIDTHLLLSSDIKKDTKLKGQQRILDVCLAIQADTYINNIGGSLMYDRQIFSEQKIELKFIKQSVEPYMQFKNSFIPSLSIVDVMMFNSVEQIILLLEGSEIIT